MIKSKYTSAITDNPWWLAGGIPREACTFVLQPQAANSETAAKYNLVNNAYVDMQYGSWAYATGFTDSAKYALPQLSNFAGKPNATTSWIAKVSNPTVDATTRYVFALRYGNTYASFYVAATTGKVGVRNNTSVNLDSAIADGIYACGGRDIYVNAVKVGTLDAATYGGSTNLDAIGTGYATTASKFLGNIHAIAFYTVGLTQYQVVALTNAMNAL